MNPSNTTEHLSLLSEPIGPIDESDLISLDPRGLDDPFARRAMHQQELKQAEQTPIVWNDWDVPIGRGRAVREFIGNERYRELVEQYRPVYLAVKKRKEKRDISDTIYRTIRSNGGRFLAPCGPRNESWYEISKDKALAKIGQALRIGVRSPTAFNSSWTYPVDGDNLRHNVPSASYPPLPLFVNLSRSASEGFTSADGHNNNNNNAAYPAELNDNISNLSFTSDDQMLPYARDFDGNNNSNEWRTSSSLDPHPF